MSNYLNEPWAVALKAECDRTTQRQVADRIGYSAAVVNQVLKGVYKGDIDKVREKVEGALMGATVDCPVVGELPRHRCIDNQARPFAATNPTRVQLYQACRSGCPHSKLRSES